MMLHCTPPTHAPSVPQTKAAALLDRTYPVSHETEQSSPPYIVSPLQLADRVDSTVDVEYATAAVAPQSGRTHAGITPLHVPSALQSRTMKDAPTNAPSKWSRKFVSQLSEQESAAAMEALAEDVNEATVCDALLKGLTWR